MTRTFFYQVLGKKTFICKSFISVSLWPRETFVIPEGSIGKYFLRGHLSCRPLPREPVCVHTGLCVIRTLEVRCEQGWRKDGLLFMSVWWHLSCCLNLYLLKKKEFLFDDSNVLCKAEHMAVQNSSDGLSFLIRNYFHTQLYWGQRVLKINEIPCGVQIVTSTWASTKRWGC